MSKKKRSQARKDVSKFCWLASFACFAAAGYRQLPESVTSSAWFIWSVVIGGLVFLWFMVASTPDEKKIKHQKKLDERAAYAAHIDKRFQGGGYSTSPQEEPPLF